MRRKRKRRQRTENARNALILYRARQRERLLMALLQAAPKPGKPARWLAELFWRCF